MKGEAADSKFRPLLDIVEDARSTLQSRHTVALKSNKKATAVVRTKRVAKAKAKAVQHR